MTTGTFSRCVAHRARAASSSSTCSGVAPFCGPKTAAAPLGPRSGAVTSLSRRTPPSGARRIREASTRARRPSAPPPSGSVVSSASNSSRPSARSAPAPPSVEAEPPRPITSARAPAFSAAAITSPSPRVVAPRGSSEPIMGSPEESASSTTAVPSGRCSQRAWSGRPSGPVTGPTATSAAPGTATAIASRVPSPPSACGTRSTSSSGRTARHPVPIAEAAAAASSDPLKESGATTTLMSGVVARS